MPEASSPSGPSGPHFTADMPIAERVQVCKRFVKAEMEKLAERHARGASGLEIARARASMMDVVIARLFDHALEAYTRQEGAPPTPVALVALGGYGRGELSPWSDVDLMFLFPPKTRPIALNPYTAYLTQEILYVLWDSGIKVGHSTRTVDQVFVEARKDIQTKTALLEARFLAGARGLYDGWAQAFRNFYTSEAPKDYIADRLEDQAHRRTKFADTVFNQEPDVKNGVGGLRDYQNAVWMARVKMGIDTVDDLVTQNYLKADEAAEFTRSYDFLLRVRNELHFASSRATDILNLDMQPRVAANLGYRTNDLLLRVEEFMHDYYRAAQTIFRTAKLIESRLALTIGRDAQGAKVSLMESLRASRFRRSQKVDGFVRRGRDLTAGSDTVFSDDPVRLLRVFRHCQQLRCGLDFHLAQKIRESLPLIDTIQNSLDAAVAFRAIMADVGDVYPTLAQMHELGVLGRYLPEFGALTLLVQHEMYHRYTADVHTLNAIRELDRIFTEAEAITLKYRAVLHELPDPALVYLTLLLHDIGKSKGIHGHSESGVLMAGPILDRLGLNAEARAQVLFVIKNHLTMARFWQKRDVDDPNTATAFAEIVGDPDRLRSLYVHTFCDSRGTSIELWNSYKDTLHTKLYRVAMDQLEQGGAAVEANHELNKKMTQQELIAKHLPGISDEEIGAHFNLLPDRYFIHAETAEVALHVQMVHALLKSIATADSVSSLRPIVEWRDDLNRSLTVVDVVTWDRAGLFYKLAGAFSVAGLNILGAKVISRADHIAIDTFHVVEPGRGAVQSASAQESFTRSIEATLMSNKDLYPEIVAQAKKLAATRYLAPNSQEVLHSSFPPTVEVYHELSMHRTIVEVQARDQLGLLYRLAKAISDQGFDITFARIGTERGVAIDTFYIENDSHEPVENADRLRALRDALTEVITPPIPEKVEVAR
jgi:[protein-PII] uridylyltransferase